MSKNQRWGRRTRSDNRPYPKSAPVRLFRGAIAYSKESFTFSPRMVRVLGDNLYTRKAEAALREPIQNAIDSGATEVHVRARQNPTNPRLTTVEIHDNGTGMSESEVRKYIAQVGATSKEGKSGKVGKFGIGKLAPIIVADKTYIRTAKGGQVTLVEVDTEGLTIVGTDDAEFTRIEQEFYNRGSKLPSGSGTTVMYDLDTESSVWDAALNNHSIRGDQGGPDGVRKLLDVMIGPTKTDIYFSAEDDTTPTKINKEFPVKGHGMQYDVRATEISDSNVRVYCKGLYVTDIPVKYASGAINSDKLHNSLTLSREDIQTLTSKDEKRFDRLKQVIINERDKMLPLVAQKVTDDEKRQMVVQAHDKRAKRIIAGMVSYKVLDGNTIVELNLSRVGMYSQSNKVVVADRWDLQDNRTELEHLSKETGTPIVFLDYGDDKRTVMDTLKAQGPKVTDWRKLPASVRAKRVKWDEVTRVADNEKRLTKEIERRYGTKFKWAEHDSSDTVAFAVGGDVYINRDGDFVKDFLAAEMPVRDKAFIFMGTAAHELAHVESGEDGHTEKWAQKMGDIKFRLSRESMLRSPTTIEGTMRQRKRLALPEKVVQTDHDKTVETAWVDGRLIARVGAYDVEVKGTPTKAKPRGSRDIKLQDNSLKLPYALEKEGKRRYGSYTIVEREYPELDLKELTKDMGSTPKEDLTPEQERALKELLG